MPAPSSQEPVSTDPAFTDFAKVVDRSVYRPLSGDWLIGLTDIVSSTEAIAKGRYKAVNMAGAALISAMINALPGSRFPFVFGGDGAAVAVPPSAEPVLRRVLAETSAWARDALGLELRAALIPVAEIEKAGHEVTLAWFAPSPNVRYAMFSGGGLAFAESELKAGRFAVTPAEIGRRPDLAGLSCRWQPAKSRRGIILSLIVRPREGAPAGAFEAAVGEILARLEAVERAGHPIPLEGPIAVVTPPGLEIDARALPGDRSPFAKLLYLRLLSFALWLIHTTGIPIGGFVPRAYRARITANSDFRKFGDGLRMTLDCDLATADAIESRLSQLRDEGRLAFGAVRQEAALITCIVPSVATTEHFHFIDGARGGYASAARQLKSGE